MTWEVFLKKMGKCVSHHRKIAELNQIEAANDSGLSYRYYQKIESGNANITVETLFRLAKTFGIDPCELIPKRDDAS